MVNSKRDTSLLLNAVIAFLLGVMTVWFVRNFAVSAEASSRQAPLYSTSKTLFRGPATSTPTYSPIPTATSTPGCIPWQIVTSPNPSQRDNALYDIAIVSSNDIWAVGNYYNDNNEAQTLTLHWDGAQWAYVPSPSPKQRNYLTGVAAVSSNDVWAVGFQQPMFSSERTLTLHWNGTVWDIVPSPEGSNVLYDVTAISPSDVWAVGKSFPGSAGGTVTLIIQWDGNQWSVVPSPSPGDGISVLRGISAISATDIWAVGTYTISTVYHSLMLHWDGAQWVHVPSPDPGPESSEHFVEGVAAISTNDVWAVGSRNPNASTLTLHWDGTAWAKVPSPNPHSQVNYLTGVSGSTSNDVWAGGWYGGRSLTLHWDGVAWGLVPSENYSQAANRLYDVGVLSSSEAWAVGQCQGCLGSGGWYRTLTERYSDPCVTSTPTSTATASPTQTTISTVASPTPTLAQPTRTSTSTPTSTATAAKAATNTATTLSTATSTSPPTATSTACTISFSDVPPDHTFYPFIRCLACRGILGGYLDGTFRPGIDVTRGQIAKIVSNAAGFNEDPGAQIYEDVDETNTFYAWINRLSLRGHMGGYPCGTVPEEPCNPPENRPYFRPFANATRGQIAKIVSNAAGFSDTPPDQIFADVLPENGFYVWIQRLAFRGVMGGYPCGGEGEPCDDQGRPYFRPLNNVTRGQTSKIVAGTFFPNCLTPGR